MRTSILLLLLGLGLFAKTYQATAQGTAFNYQGRLNSGGNPAVGLYDFRFRLHADSQGNTTLGTLLTNGIPVTNGLFTTTIDFGAGAFNGSNYWLEVDVRTNDPANTLAYTTLSPFQSLNPTPYAIFANTASNVSGTVSAGQLSGAIVNGNLPVNPVFSGTITAGGVRAQTFFGNGGGLTNLNVSYLVGGVISQTLLPGFQSINNFSTVSGGGLNSAHGGFGTVGGGYTNSASGNYSTVGGGANNIPPMTMTWWPVALTTLRVAKMRR